MPAPTIANFFGANATILTANETVAAAAGDPVLVVRFSDLAAAGWDALQTGDATDPEKWATAIVRMIDAFSTANTDEVPNVYTSDAPFQSLGTRNGTTKRIYGYTLNIAIPDSGSAHPDPDQV